MGSAQDVVAALGLGECSPSRQHFVRKILADLLALGKTSSTFCPTTYE